MDALCNHVLTAIDNKESLHFLAGCTEKEKIALGQDLAQTLLKDILRFIQVGGCFAEYYSMSIHDEFLKCLKLEECKGLIAREIYTHLDMLLGEIVIKFEAQWKNSHLKNIGKDYFEIADKWEKWHRIKGVFEHMPIWTLTSNEFAFAMRCLFELDISLFAIAFSDISNDFIRLGVLFGIPLKDGVADALIDEILNNNLPNDNWLCILIFGFFIIFNEPSEIVPTINKHKDYLVEFAVSFFITNLPHSAIAHPLWDDMVRIFSFQLVKEGFLRESPNLTMLVSILAVLENSKNINMNESSQFYADNFLHWLSPKNDSFLLSDHPIHQIHYQRFIDKTALYLQQSDNNWITPVQETIQAHTRCYTGWQDKVDFHSKPHYMFSPLCQIYIKAVAAAYKTDKTEGWIEHMRWLINHLVKYLPDTLEAKYDNAVVDTLFEFIPAYDEHLDDNICDLLELTVSTDTLAQLLSKYCNNGGASTKIINYIKSIWDSRKQLHDIMDEGEYTQLAELYEYFLPIQTVTDTN